MTFSTFPGIECTLPPHAEPLHFTTLARYEAHYALHHTNLCPSCCAIFPSTHLLHLHMEEEHSSLTTLRHERGEATFGCFDSECTEKCRTREARKEHLITRHGYPTRYFYDITKRGVGKLVERYGAGVSLVTQTDEAIPQRVDVQPAQTTSKKRKEASYDSEDESPSILQQRDALVEAITALSLVPLSVSRRARERNKMID